MPDVCVVGLLGDRPVGREAEAALARATLVVGGSRQIAAVAGRTTGEQHDLTGDLDAAIAHIEDHDGESVVVASGDPGFFGIVRRLAHLEPIVYPAPSSVSLAFARLGLSWDDALVVSAHGRPLHDAAELAARAPKVAVLVSPDNPPDKIGGALAELGATHDRVVVCSRLGTVEETITETDLVGLIAGSWDPLSVLVLMGSTPSSGPSVSWGRPVEAFAHRASMITKPEVRAVVLAKLELPTSGVLWDLGAGSGSVGIEAAVAAPGLAVTAVEQHEGDVERILANARELGADLTVVHGAAPAALDELAGPDRVFVGGGGLQVLRAALARLAPGGRIVATYAAMDRALVARDLLGEMIQMQVARSEPLGDGVRLAADNPVFIAWGPARGTKSEKDQGPRS